MRHTSTENLRAGLALLLLLGASAGLAAQGEGEKAAKSEEDGPPRTEVNVFQMLGELADPLAVLRAAKPAFQVHAAASRPEAPFLREEKRGQRLERVLFEAKGPGALIELALGEAKGTLRFYVDGKALPAILVEAALLVRGEITLFAVPFTSPAGKGGRFRYPIPFEKDLKVTCDEGGFAWSAAWRGHGEKTTVTSFEMKDAAIQTFMAMPGLAPFLSTLGLPLHAPAEASLTVVDPAGVQCDLAAGEEKTVLRREGEKGGMLRLFLAEETLPFLSGEAGRAVICRMEVDGEVAADLPLCDLLGGGEAEALFNTTAFSTTLLAGGALLRRESRLPVPFAKKLVISLRNEGKATVRGLRFQFEIEDAAIGEDTLFFHAGRDAAAVEAGRRLVATLGAAAGPALPDPDDHFTARIGEKTLRLSAWDALQARPGDRVFFWYAKR